MADDDDIGTWVAQAQPDVSRSYTDMRAQAGVDRALEQMRAYRQQQQQNPPTPIAQEAARVGRGIQSGAAAAVDTASEVVRQAADVPLQLPAGVIDGVREAFRAGDDIADALQRLTGEGLPADRPANWADRPGHMVADAIPQPFPDARTPAGSVARQGAAIVYGFARGMRLTRGVAEAAGTVGRIVQPFAAGAIADALFTDPRQERLSNAWQQMGLPPNALTDYLAAQPGDTAAEGRLKSAIEGTVQGAALDLVLATARGARAAMRARLGTAGEPEADRILAEARRQYGEMDPQRVNALLGDADPDAPRVMISGRVRDGVDETEAAQQRLNARMRRAARDTGEVVGDQGERGGMVAAQLGDAGSSARPGVEPSVFVNFSRIAEPDDVSAVIRDMAEVFAPSIDAARRGRVSNETTQAIADQMGITVDDIIARRRGPMSASEAVAARELLNQSAATLAATARAAADAGAGPAEMFAFRRMMAIHYAVQAEVLAARTETARALQSWSIPVGGGAETARAVQQALEASGGTASQQAIARRMVELLDSGAGPAAIARFTRASALRRSFDAVQEAWINGLLSSPTTHMINVTSNTVAAFTQVWERALAARVGRIAGDPGGAQPGEALAMVYGMVTGITDAFRLAARVYREGNGGAVAQMLGRTDVPRDAAISSQAFGLSQASGLGRAIDLFGHHLVRQPSRLLNAEDAFFKSINYRMELHAASLREAASRVGPDGQPLRGAALYEEMARLVNNPPEHIRLQAAEAALYATFNREGGNVAQGLIALREHVPPVAFVLPFIRTPANILSYTFERTPLAPLVGQWRADIRAGGARRDLALARLSAGSAALAVGFDIADRTSVPGPNGQPQEFEVSGSGPDPQRESGRREALIRQGWQPYSIRVGDRWYSYNRLDPVGFILGFAADTRDLVRRREIAPEDVDELNEVIARAGAAVAASVVDRTWMQGVANLVEALDEAGEGGLQRYLQQTAGSFVPAGVAALERAQQPQVSQPSSPYEAILARIPFLSAQVPLRRDLWGQEVRPDSGLGPVAGAVSPMPARQVVDSPIDREMARLDVNVESIGRRTRWGAADVNLQDWPAVYDAYRRLAGNEMRHPAWNMGARDLLNAVVEGRHELSEVYRQLSDGRDGGKAQFIRSVIQQYREEARRAIEADPAFADFTAFIRGRQDERQQQRMRVPGIQLPARQ